VVFECDGLKGDTQDFKMPVWMPGLYRIMDYAKDVVNFKAVDGAGRPLPWAKTT
jgi:predicted metalloprotease with PDZ domain